MRGLSFDKDSNLKGKNKENKRPNDTFNIDVEKGKNSESAEHLPVLGDRIRRDSQESQNDHDSRISLPKRTKKSEKRGNSTVSLSSEHPAQTDIEKERRGRSDSAQREFVLFPQVKLFSQCDTKMPT